MTVASEQEVIGAQAFLRGIGADATDNQMIVAVVSWFRQESGSIERVIGNNPFNIRPGVTSGLASGVRHTGSIGDFLTFPDLATGFEAAATLLKSLAPAYGYGTVIKAAQSGDAIGFLAALAMSSWDAGHYGVTWRSGSTGGIDNSRTLQNHLLRVFAMFTGLQLPNGTTISKTAVKAAATVKAAGAIDSPASHLPGQFTAFGHTAFTRPDYVNAATTAQFYRAKHPLRKA